MLDSIPQESMLTVRESAWILVECSAASHLVMYSTISRTTVVRGINIGFLLTHWPMLIHFIRPKIRSCPTLAQLIKHQCGLALSRHINHREFITGHFRLILSSISPAQVYLIKQSVSSLLFKLQHLVIKHQHCPIKHQNWLIKLQSSRVPQP